MKNLFDGSRINIEGDSRIYVQGDYTPWHNEDEDILEVYENGKKNEEIKLDKRIYKRIAKYSEPEYWDKNIDFFKKLYLKTEQGKLKEVNLIEKDDWGDLSSKLYYSLLEIDGNCIPVPIVTKVINLFGTYDLSTRKPTRKNLKKAYKTWDALEKTFNKIDMEEYKEMKIEKWSQITAIEKVADFVANFMKETGVESKKVISDIMDNLHKDWKDDFDNIEFRNITFVKQDDPKDFGHDIILNSQSREHSWAGEESNEDTATLLYSSDSSFEFGQDYSYEYSNNGNTEREDSDYSDGNFNISSTYVILIKTEQHSTYNRDYYDYVGYKCIAYVGDESVYKFEHEEIIKKYDIDKKVKENALYLIHTSEILEKDCPMPIWEVLTEKEFDKKPNSCFDDYWKGTNFTEITSIEDFENHPNNFCQAQDDMMEKIYNFFGGK